MISSHLDDRSGGAGFGIVAERFKVFENDVFNCEVDECE